jgi:hypothetical protein
MALEYIIYCDESSEKGPHYSDFYGGALVTSEHLDEVRTTLENKKKELNFNGEVKWNKVPGNKYYAKKYRDLMDCFFDLVAARKVKIRIMFRQNTIQSTHLTQDHHDQKFFILYYLFLKQGFGLDCSPVIPGGVRVRIYPDQIPDTKEQLDRFRNFLARMSNRPELRERNIRVAKEDITDVVSHEHVILQCLDIVLGSMHFKLNDLHKKKIPGKIHREKRTREKDKLYKLINYRIRQIYPNFNVGAPTARREIDSRWTDEYRHWLLMPRSRNRVVLPGSKHKIRKKVTEAP